MIRIRIFSCPDPGVKKASDPGSESATLQFWIILDWILFIFNKPRQPLSLGTVLRIHDILG